MQDFTAILNTPSVSIKGKITHFIIHHAVFPGNKPDEARDQNRLIATRPYVYLGHMEMDEKIPTT
jgi:hypothetical protein